jgi:hypothetical protein
LTSFAKCVNLLAKLNFLPYGKEGARMRSDSWLLIIIRSLKGVRTLQIENRTIVILTCGAIFFTGAFIFFGYEYFSLLGERRQLTDQVRQLKNQVSTLEQQLEKASLGIMLSKPHSSLLAVEELQVIRRANRGGVSVRFRLVNKSPREIPISGTLAMVAKNESLRNPIYQVIPEMRLTKGVPQEPEKGSRFEVRRQKFVEAFFDSPPEGVFKTLTIYIFSSEGKLILQTSTEVKEE